MHPDGSGLSQVTSDTSLAGDRALTALISGSGNRIAFISDTDPLGTNPERRPKGLAVDRDGQNLVQLGNLPLDSWSPAPLLTISDDGTRLLRNHQVPSSRLGAGSTNDLADHRASIPCNRIPSHGIARVPDAIAIRIGLTRIEDTGTVVAGVADVVGVDVVLSRVRILWAVVGDVLDTVSVPIEIACVPDSIRVLVRLIRVGGVRAVIADITVRVPIHVRLRGVLESRAVVGSLDRSIAVGIEDRVRTPIRDESRHHDWSTAGISPQWALLPVRANRRNEVVEERLGSRRQRVGRRRRREPARYALVV
jgi:hypothetical protein